MVMINVNLREIGVSVDFWAHQSTLRFIPSSHLSTWCCIPSPHLSTWCCIPSPHLPIYYGFLTAQVLEGLYQSAQLRSPGLPMAVQFLWQSYRHKPVHFL